MGFGYDGLHEMWNGYREGLSAMACWSSPPMSYYDGPDGLRVAWLESAAERIPQETLLRVPQGGIPLDDLTGALKGTRFEGAAQACSWVLAETGNFFLDHTYDDGSYDGFADPWEDDIIAEGTEEWRKASALMDSVSKLTDWLEEDLPGRFAEMLDFTLERLPTKKRRKTNMTNEVDTTQWSLPGPTDMPRDDLNCSWRSTERPSSCGASRTTPPGSGPSRRTRSPTCSPSTWGSPRGCCRRKPSGGTRARPDRWWPSGGRRRSGWWPCNGRRSSLPPGSGFPCRGWSSSARRAARPGSTRQRAVRPTPSSTSSGPRPSTSSATGRVCPGSHRFPEEVGLIPESFFQSFFSLTGDTRNRSKKHPDNLSHYGRR